MSNKRRNTSSPECEESPKRRQTEAAQGALSYDDHEDDGYEGRANERPQIDTYTGQAGAFPGLSNANDEVFYGPANDGIDYLRMVRSEAQGIPTLLRARTEAEAEDVKSEDEVGGYWDNEGTYTAGPQLAVSVAESPMTKAQIEYYKSLLNHFASVRATLACVPSLTAIEKLTSSQPISFPNESRNARGLWSECIRTREPSPAQIACMDQNSILELIRLLTFKMRGLFSTTEANSTQRTGAWMWAVLGKCPDRGQLGGEEISELRQFARKAIEVRNLIHRSQSPQKFGFPIEPDRELSDGEMDEDDHDHLSANIEAAKIRLATSPELKETLNSDLQTPSHFENTSEIPASRTNVVLREKATVLDMIVTIVGEFYGQRDLLEERHTWSAK